MTSKRKIIYQAVAASAALAFVGVTFNTINLTAPTVSEVEPISMEVDTRPMPPSDLEVIEGRGERELTPEEFRESIARERAMAEHGEVGEFEIRTSVGTARSAPADRAAAIKRVEDIHARLDEPGVPLVEREMLEKEKDAILSPYLAPAAGEEPPGGDGIVEEGPPPPEFGESKNGDEDAGLLGGLDINNVFNKVWGLLQGIILAWVGVKLGQRSKQ